MIFNLRAALALFTVIFLFQCSADKTSSPTKGDLEQMLNDHTLDMWYPRVNDHINGGYYSNFTFDWTKDKMQDKFLVTQARHVWTLSKAFEFYPDRTSYKEFAKHGFEFMKEFLWDNEHGGFYQLVDSTGQVPQGEYSFEKRTYGNVFAIYSLAAYYKISKDQEVLDLAIDGFHWLLENAHDGEHGGYFQFLQRDGCPIPRAALQDGYNASDNAMVGLKDYNSSIHILEAFTELHQVWPNKILKGQLLEMYKVVSETMYDPRGFLKLNFYPDWTEVPDEDIMKVTEDYSYYVSHITFGHDVETAFLLIEAAEALGLSKENYLPKAKRMVDHALKNGWDTEKGGFYEQGKYIDGKVKILDKGKNWWAQAEGMNSLLLMHNIYPEDPMNYYEKFELIYQYIDQNLIDHEQKGWYSWGIDERPKTQKSNKAHNWKGTYHTSRSLMHCMKMMGENEH